MNNRDITALVVSYNTRDTTLRCLQELDELCGRSGGVKVQTIVVDNASTDGSYTALEQWRMQHCEYLCLQQSTNRGFGAANNSGFSHATGRYVLLLNSDVMTVSTSHPVDLSALCAYMDQHPGVGALTVKVELKDGSIDPASHRGFPTVWRSITYFAGGERLLTWARVRNRRLRNLLGGYHLMGEDTSREHPIDAGTAAFLLVRSSVLGELGGFDEAFFMYGEDLDLCYRMRSAGYAVMWIPSGTVTHLKYQSGLASHDPKVRKMVRWHFYDAMERFFLKHYAQRVCPCVRFALLAIVRLVKNVI